MIVDAVNTSIATDSNPLPLGHLILMAAVKIAPPNPKNASSRKATSKKAISNKVISGKLEPGQARSKQAGSDKAVSVTVRPTPPNFANPSVRQWYILDKEGDFALRIRNGVKLGERADGQLALSDKVKDYQWIRLCVNADNELWLTIINKDVKLQTVGQRHFEHYKLFPGDKLELPNNTLTIGEHPFLCELTGNIIRVLTEDAADMLAEAPLVQTVQQQEQQKEQRGIQQEERPQPEQIIAMANGADTCEPFIADRKIPVLGGCDSQIAKNKLMDDVNKICAGTPTRNSDTSTKLEFKSEFVAQPSSKVCSPQFRSIRDQHIVTGYPVAGRALVIRKTVVISLKLGLLLGLGAVFFQLYAG